MGDIDMVGGNNEWSHHFPGMVARTTVLGAQGGEPSAILWRNHCRQHFGKAWFIHQYVYVYVYCIYIYIYTHCTYIHDIINIYYYIYIYIYKYIFDHCSCEETTSQGQIGLKNQAGGSLPTDVLVSLRPISSNGKCSAQCSFPPNSTSWDLRDVWPNFKLAGGLQQKAGFRCLPLPCGVHPIPQRPLTNARTLRTSVCCCTEVGKARHGWH